MPSNELETIAASIQDALHRAYAMGRNDALRRVVELVQADELGAKTVPLLSHSEPPPVEAPHGEESGGDQHVEADPIHLPQVPNGADTVAASGEASRQDAAERTELPPQKERILAQPGSMGSFLLDFFYPIKPKK